MLSGVISKFEQRAIFSMAAGLFFLRIVELTVSLVVQKPTVDADGLKISYGTIPSYTMDILSPVICFVVFLWIASMLWTFSRETLVVSLVPLLLLTLFFYYWVIDSQIRVRQMLHVNPEYPWRQLDHVMISSSIYDLVTLFLVNVLLIWQISMIYRLISSNRHSRLV